MDGLEDAREGGGSVKSQREDEAEAAEVRVTQATPGS